MKGSGQPRLCNALKLAAVIHCRKATDCLGCPLDQSECHEAKQLTAEEYARDIIADYYRKVNIKPIARKHPIVQAALDAVKGLILAEEGR